MPSASPAAWLATASDARASSLRYQAPSRPCGFCGRSAPIQRHFVVDALRVPVCARCKDRQLGICTQCGRQAPLYGVRQRVALRCGRCWDRHSGKCPRCGLKAPLLDQDGSMACERCYSVRVRTCGTCGETRRIKVRGRGDDPDICERCWRISRNAKLLSASCRIRLPWSFGCRDCGVVGRRVRGRCPACALPARVDELFPGSPLRQILVAARSPRAVLGWIERHRSLLETLHAADRPLSHQALDDLPSRRSVEWLRAALLATGLLPERERYAADLERWARPIIKEFPAPDDRVLLSEFVQWRLAMALRRRAAQYRLTYDALSLAKTRFTMATVFLQWLHDHQLALAKCTQADVDTFIVEHPRARPHLDVLLRWGSRRELCEELVGRRIRGGPAPRMVSVSERWSMLERLLDDESLDPRDRVAGCLVLLYAQPLTRLLALRTEHVIMTGDDGERAFLRLGSDAVEVPPKLARLIAQLLLRRASPCALSLPPSPWLFPGLKPGQALSDVQLKVRLNKLGIPPRAMRRRALMHLAQRLDPPVLAPLLGFSPTTMALWFEHAGRNFSGYVADRAGAHGQRKTAE